MKRKIKMGLFNVDTSGSRKEVHNFIGLVDHKPKCMNTFKWDKMI